MRFKTTDSLVRIGHIGPPSDNFTVVSLLRPYYGQNINGYAWILGHGTPAATNSWSVGLHTGATGLTDGIAWVAHNAGLSDDARMVVPNKWAVVGWQRDATVWKSWLDGVLRSNNMGTASPGATSGNTYINATFTSANAGLAGDIVYIGMWDRVLTSAEMFYLGRGGNPRAIPNPHVLWDMTKQYCVDRATAGAGYLMGFNSGAPVEGEQPYGAFSFYSAVEILASQPDKQDIGTVNIDISVTGDEDVGTTDSATISVDIRNLTSDNAIFVDVSTVYYNIQIESHDCHTKWDASQLFARTFDRFETEANHRWNVLVPDRFIVVAGDGLEEC